MKTKRVLALAMAVLMSMVLLAGCNSKNSGPTSDMDKITKAGKIVIGITDYRPVNFYEDDGTLTGFDTEYAQIVAKELGVEAEFIEIDWDNKEIELNAGNIDAVWNGMTYTEERAQNMDFSKPYILNEIVVVIRAADADKYKTTEDLVSSRVVAEGGSTGEEEVLADEYLKDSNFTPVDSLISSLMEVSAGTADAAAVDSVMANELVGYGAYSDLIKIPGVILADEVLAIGFRKGSDLVAEIDNITDTLRSDGTFQALSDKYKVTLVG